MVQNFNRFANIVIQLMNLKSCFNNINIIIFIRMNIEAKRLIEFCNNNNNFSDSEDESLEEEDESLYLEEDDENLYLEDEDDSLEDEDDSLEDEDDSLEDEDERLEDEDERLEDEQRVHLNKTDPVVVEQPLSCESSPISDKITIIVDSSNVSQEINCESGWENIEFAELDDVIFDNSLVQVIKEKTL